MNSHSLFKALVGTLPAAKLDSPLPGIEPSTVTSVFLEKGHVMEYIEVGSEAKKVVSLFFGPNEFVVRCHLNYSVLVSLDDVMSNQFRHRVVLGTLLRFPESRIQYMGLRKRYQEKVAERIRTLTEMTGPQRFLHLKKKQPWVLKLAKIEDIASYLAISVEMAMALKKKS
jgi:hypothetical protein